MAEKIILIVGGDLVLYQSLKEQIELHAEYACKSSVDAVSAMAELRKDGADILLIDTALPDVEGRRLCRELRAEGFDLPIIMLAGPAWEDDAGGDPEACASDVIVKPFRIAVLIGRIRSLLRAREQNEDAVLSIGPYVFRASAKTLTDGAGDLIRLTEKEANILKYLLHAGSQIVSRDVLLAEVWGYNSGVTTHTLETHIYRLRQKIEEDPSNAVILVTEGGGYRLVP
jgi:DNA-binding response OmpR family regulator